MSLRDILLTLLLVGLLPIAFKRPFIGALIFAVVSLANPHRFTWGFAYTMPWALAYAGATMAGLLSTREGLIGDSIKRYMPVLIYLAWMVVTTTFALERGEAVHRLTEIAKIHLMCLVTLSLLTDWQRVKQLVWVTVCSIAFFGLKGGIFTLTSGGENLVWGPPDSAIGDNNHLAVALVMMLPLLYWLFTEAKRRWLKALILFSALMCIASIFGSHSRSAFLAILAISGFLLLKSRQKLAVALVTIVAGIGIATFMPQDYWNRMETIENYQADASAMGRINVWKTAINIANDRITGAGFEYYGPRAFRRYAPNPNDIHSSHSIYFQSLGEQGWIGLGMYLFIWAYIWLRCRRVIKQADESEDGRSQALLARMIQVSLLGFGVGGAFVNIGNWDMVYYLAVAALGTARVVTRQVVPETSPSLRKAGLPRKRVGAATPRRTQTWLAPSTRRDPSR